MLPFVLITKQLVGDSRMVESPDRASIVDMYWEHVLALDRIFTLTGRLAIEVGNRSSADFGQSPGSSAGRGCGRLPQGLLVQSTCHGSRRCPGTRLLQRGI